MITITHGFSVYDNATMITITLGFSVYDNATQLMLYDNGGRKRKLCDWWGYMLIKIPLSLLYCI